MAKKKFDIKSTIAVQPKSFSVDDVESAVQKIHDAKEKPEAHPAPAKKKVETASVKARKEKETKERTPKSAAPAPARKRGRPKSPEAPQRKVRLSVDVTPETHKRLKIKAIEMDSDIMHYVEMLIERDLGKK